MIMEDGVIVPDRAGMTDRQVALIAAAITNARVSVPDNFIYERAEKYLEWLRRGV